MVVKRNMEPMEVEFLREWMGNTKGSKRKIYGWAAEELIEQGIAKDAAWVGKEEPASEVNRLEGEEKVEEETGKQGSKAISKPLRDKMIKDPKVKK